MCVCVCIYVYTYIYKGFPGGTSGKNVPLPKQEM